jgi:hypothetical protein
MGFGGIGIMCLTSRGIMLRRMSRKGGTCRIGHEREEDFVCKIYQVEAKSSGRWSFSSESHWVDSSDFPSDCECAPTQACLIVN